VNNPTVMADWTLAVFKVSGGQAPYDWVLDGEGVFFSPTSESKTVTTNHPSVWVYSRDTCGTLKLSVTDNCGTTADYHFLSANGSWTTVEYRYWDFYDWSPFPTDLSCTFSGAEDNDFPPVDETNTLLADSVNETSWYRYVMQGFYRFTERGNSNTRTILDFAPSDCLNVGDRLDIRNVWPSCSGVPAGVVDYIDCSVWWTCRKCCYERPGDFILRSDRYGVTICGTRTYILGYQIKSRRWETWDC